MFNWHEINGSGTCPDHHRENLSGLYCLDFFLLTYDKIRISGYPISGYFFISFIPFLMLFLSIFSFFSLSLFFICSSLSLFLNVALSFSVSFFISFLFILFHCRSPATPTKSLPPDIDLNDPEVIYAELRIRVESDRIQIQPNRIQIRL